MSPWPGGSFRLRTRQDPSWYIGSRDLPEMSLCCDPCGALCATISISSDGHPAYLGWFGFLNRTPISPCHMTAIDRRPRQESNSRPVWWVLSGSGREWRSYPIAGEGKVGDWGEAIPRRDRRVGDQRPCGALGKNRTLAPSGGCCRVRAVNGGPTRLRGRERSEIRGRGDPEKGSQGWGSASLWRPRQESNLRHPV